GGGGEGWGGGGGGRRACALAAFGRAHPRALSVRLTTLRARGPEDCRACTSQSRAAAQVHPRVRPVQPPGLTQPGGLSDAASYSSTNMFATNLIVTNMFVKLGAEPRTGSNPASSPVSPLRSQCHVDHRPARRRSVSGESHPVSVSQADVGHPRRGPRR